MVWNLLKFSHSIDVKFLPLAFPAATAPSLLPPLPLSPLSPLFPPWASIFRSKADLPGSGIAVEGGVRGEEEGNRDRAAGWLDISSPAVILKGGRLTGQSEHLQLKELPSIALGNCPHAECVAHGPCHPSQPAEGSVPFFMRNIWTFVSGINYIFSVSVVPPTMPADILRPQNASSQPDVTDSAEKIGLTGGHSGNMNWVYESYI